MGRLIHVPKPPKKPNRFWSQSKLIARAVLSTDYTCQNIFLGKARRIIKMGPKDPKDLSDTNGNTNPGAKGKGRIKKTRSSSRISLTKLSDEDVDEGISAVQQISKILCFVQAYPEEIDNADRIYGLGIRQQDRISQLETTLHELTIHQDQELIKLRDENDEYYNNAHDIELKKEQLEREKASSDDRRRAMEAEMRKQKEKELQEAKQGMSDKFKVKFKEMKEQLENKIQTLEADKHGLEDTIKILENINIVTQEENNRQREEFEIDKRSSQSHIKGLESDIRQLNALSTVSPQVPTFYADSFRQLWDGIRDIAVNDLSFLPEDGTLLAGDTVRDQLSDVSKIFRYPLLSSESPVAIFLRACAVQNFLSATTVSVVGRRYFAEVSAVGGGQPTVQPMDSILETISNVAAANSRQDLSWRLLTVDKLDRVGSHDSSVTPTVSTQPNEGDIRKTILERLHYFQGVSDDRLKSKLAKIADIVINLWSALRKDSCRIEFDYGPSKGDGKRWEFVDYATNHSSEVPGSPTNLVPRRIPSNHFALFPRITGFFDTDNASPQVLHAGVALSCDSPAFQENLQEIEHVDFATKELKRGIRRGSSAQSSPILDNRQRKWPPMHVVH